MNPDVTEWLHLLLRWMHIIAAIRWIGSSIVVVLLGPHLEQTSNGLAVALTAALIVGASIFLVKVMSGRAAYMHVGAMIGTWMVANVWMRIIPAQRGLVAAVKAGKKPDETLALRAKQRSRHNS